MSRTTHVNYVSHPDATGKRESEVLATVYAFILECQAKSKALEGAGDQANSHNTEGSHHVRAMINAIARVAGH